MIEPKTSRMRRGLIVLTLMAAILLLCGCVTYRTSIAQNFKENGDSDIVVRERLAVDPGLTRDYLAQSGLGDEAGPQAGSMLLQGLGEYFSSGAHARGICGRVAAPFKCAVQADGGVEISGPMQPDGRFYVFSTRRDWLELKETREYDIRRAPLAGFFAYSDMNETERATEERAGLRQFMDAYIDQHISQLPADSCIGAQTLGCAVERAQGGLIVRLSLDPNYTVDLSRTRVLRALCSFKTADEFGPDAYQQGRADLHEAHSVNLTLDAIGSAGLRIPCDAGAQTLALEVAYPAGLGPDASALLVYRMPRREQIQWQMHQSLLDNGTLMAALSKYSTGQFSEVTAEFGPGRMRGRVFNDLAKLMRQGGLGTDVQFEYEMNFPDGKINATLNGHAFEVTGSKLTLSLEQLSHGGTGDGLVVKVQKYISPLGGYTWLVINLVFLLIMAVVVWQSMKRYKLPWMPRPPPTM